MFFYFLFFSTLATGLLFSQNEYDKTQNGAGGPHIPSHRSKLLRGRGFQEEGGVETTVQGPGALPGRVEVPGSQAQHWGEGTMPFPKSTGTRLQPFTKMPPRVPSSANSLKFGTGVPRGLGVRDFMI